MLSQEGNKLVYHYDAEELWIEPWGDNAVRVRATKNARMPEADWALLPPRERRSSVAVSAEGADLVQNGVICNEEPDEEAKEACRSLGKALAQ